MEKNIPLPFSAASSKRFVDIPGNVTSMLNVLNASTRDAIFVLPSKPAMLSSTSVNETCQELGSLPIMSSNIPFFPTKSLRV